jgi:hypothetical protein
MARLIEVPDVALCRSPLIIQVGDALLFHGMGGHVRSGGDAIEMLGPFVQAIVGENGGVLTPSGPPNTVVYRARRTGPATIEIVTGNFNSPITTSLQVEIEP